MLFSSFPFTREISATTKEIGDNENFKVHHLFKLFGDCHFQFLLLGGLATNLWDVYDQVENTTKSIFGSVPLSTYAITMKTFQPNNFAIRNNPASRITCLLHLYFYIEEGFIFDLAVHNFIYSILFSIRLARVWPHHSIFLSYLKANQTNLKFMRDSFFTYGLRKSATRGLILFVNLKTFLAQLVCIPCGNEISSIFTPVEKPSITMNQLQWQMKIINSNMREGLVFSGSFPEAIYKSLCSKKAIPDRKAIFLFPPRLIDCAHFILRNKLNYTYDWGNAIIVASARMAAINEYNLNSVTATRLAKWSPYLANFEHFHLIFYQPRPTISADILVIAFKWQVWLLLLVCVILLVIVTALWASVHKITLSPSGFVLMVPTSSFLEQDIPSEKKIPPVWRLWILLMIVLSSAYRGRIYNLLTHGITPMWPSTLKELVLDRTYLTITISTIFFLVPETEIVRKSSALRQEFLAPSMIGTAGVDFPVEFYLLNKSLIFYEKNTSFVKDVFFQNAFRDDKSFAYTYEDKHLYKKLATINRPVDNSLIHRLVMSVYPDVVSSSIQKFTEHQVVQLPMVTNSFFFEYFENALGLLDHSGFTVMFERHLIRMRACNSTISSVKNLTMHYGVEIDLEKAFRRCYVMVMFGNGNVELTSKSAPLGMDELFVIFILFLCLFGALLIIFCLEVLQSNIKSW